MCCPARSRTARRCFAGQPVDDRQCRGLQGQRQAARARRQAGIRELRRRRASRSTSSRSPMPAASGSSRRAAGHSIKLLVPEGEHIPDGQRHLPSTPHIRRSTKTAGWWGAPMNKTVNKKPGCSSCRSSLLVAFNALIPLMTVVNFSVQESFGDNVFFWAGVQLVRAGAAFRPLPRRAPAPDRSSRRIVLADRDSARPCHRARHAAQRPVGFGLPRADGTAAAHSVERRRRHVEHLRAARHRLARQR